MDHHASSPLNPKTWTCKHCGCCQSRPCTIEITVTRPNGARATLFTHECAQSASGLCTACDECLLPELASLLDVWRQLGSIAMAFRTAAE